MNDDWLDICDALALGPALMSLSNYDPLVNKIILSIVVNVITESKRFDDPLIQC